MRIKLLTMGKTDVDWVRKGIELYSSRLSHYIQFSIKEIPELKKASSLSQEQIKTKEGELLLSEISSSEYVVLLDERGKERRSVDFASYIEDRMVRGGKDMVFIIGGAYGFSQSVYERSNDKISLSLMTFSHQMVRAVFLEQLYRAFTIIRGEPYHHE